MGALDTVRSALESHGCNPRGGDRSFTARCPAHDDRSPSLSVSAGRDQPVVFTCHAGCATTDVLAALGLTMADICSTNGDRPKGRRIVATYPYTDEHGEVLFEVVRYDPKDFRQRQPDGAWNIQGVRRVLYRLPEVLAAVERGDPVYVVEGEKDADAIVRAGGVATCNPTGAGKWSKVPDAAQVLTDADVIIVADRDATGLDHARQVAASLDGKAKSITVVQAITGKDAADHLGAGHGLGELEPVDLGGEDVNDEPRTSWAPIDLSHLVGGYTPEPARWLRRSDGLALVYPGRVHWLIGESEALKSWIMMIAGIEAIAAGGRFAYVDFEDDEVTFFERMSGLGVAEDVLADLDRVRYLRPEEGVVAPEGKTSPAGLDFAELARWEPDVVALDGVAAGMSLDGLDPNSNSDVAGWMRAVPRPLARAGAAVIASDHVTKNREGRGRYAIGAVHKLNGLDGAAYTAECLKPLGRAFLDPVEGLTRLTVVKDRRGHVRGAIPGGTGPVADISITAWPDGGITTSIDRPGAGAKDSFARKIAEHLAIYDGASKNDVRKLGNSDSIDAAVMEMVAAGHLDVRQQGQAHRHYLTPAGRAFYGVEDDE